MRDQQLLRRVPHRSRIVHHQRLRMDVLQQMRRGDIGHVERRILTHQHDVHRAQIQFRHLPERVMTAEPALHGHRAGTGEQALLAFRAVRFRTPSRSAMWRTS